MNNGGGKLEIMRIYLDRCCYNRPFDDLSQNRIHDESDAVLSILNRSQTDGTVIIGSQILRMEIDKIHDEGKKFKVKSLYGAVMESVEYSAFIKERAEVLRKVAVIHVMDSLHIASAEAAHADVFLSTDDKLVRACRKLSLHVRVMNPVSYLAEVIENDGR